MTKDTSTNPTRRDEVEHIIRSVFEGEPTNPELESHLHGQGETVAAGVSDAQVDRFNQVWSAQRGLPLETLTTDERGRWDTSVRIALEAAALSSIDTAGPAGEWHTGEPPKPWREEWFIAQTTFGDRVVLRALPEEWTYDYKTADETHIKADRIARWMQFPDSQFLPFTAPSAIGGEAEPVAWQYRVWFTDTQKWSDWRYGKNPKEFDNDFEERPLYLSRQGGVK